MNYKTINIKEDHPTVELALANLEIEIEVARFEGCKVLKVIHGYGSHGVGGAICLELRRYLRQLKNQNKIKDYLYGDEWDISNEKCFQVKESIEKIKKVCPDLLGDVELFYINSGVTIILL